MEDDYAERPIARGFMPAAIASLLFMLLGCAAYVMHVTADPASLEPDQRAALAAEPLWVTAAFAVAVWVGLLGALMLVLRRKLAVPALLIALLAVIVWAAGLVLVPALSEAISTNDLIVPIVVAALTWTIYWFARRSRRRGWLR